MELLDELLVLHHGTWKIYKIDNTVLVETDVPRITWEYEYENDILKQIYHSMSILNYCFFSKKKKEL